MTAVTMRLAGLAILLTIAGSVVLFLTQVVPDDPATDSDISRLLLLSVPLFLPWAFLFVYVRSRFPINLAADFPDMLIQKFLYCLGIAIGCLSVFFATINKLDIKPTLCSERSCLFIHTVTTGFKPQALVASRRIVRNRLRAASRFANATFWRSGDVYGRSCSQHIQ